MPIPATPSAEQVIATTRAWVDKAVSAFPDAAGIFEKTWKRCAGSGSQAGKRSSWINNPISGSNRKTCFTDVPLGRQSRGKEALASYQNSNKSAYYNALSKYNLR